MITSYYNYHLQGELNFLVSHWIRVKNIASMVMWLIQKINQNYQAGSLVLSPFLLSSRSKELLSLISSPLDRQSVSKERRKVSPWVHNKRKFLHKNLLPTCTRPLKQQSLISRPLTYASIAWLANWFFSSSQEFRVLYWSDPATAWKFNWIFGPLFPTSRSSQRSCSSQRFVPHGH